MNREIVNSRFLTGQNSLPWLAACLLLTLTLWQACLRAEWIWSKPYPISTDAYFYIQELAFRAATGHGYYTQNSPFFAALSFVQRISGIEPTLLFELSVFLSLCLFSLAIGIIAFRREQPWMATALVFSFWCSDLIFYRHYAFLKLSLAMACTAIGIAYIERAPHQTKGVSARAAAAILLLFFGAVSHLLSGATVVVYLLLGKLRLPFLVRSALIGSAIAAAAVYLQSHHKFILSSGIDSFAPGIVAACSFSGCSTFEWLEISIYGFVLVSLFVLLIHSKLFPRQPCIWLLLFVALNLPVWSTTGHTAYRLALASIWFLFLGIASLNGLRDASLDLPLKRITAIMAVMIGVGFYGLDRTIYTGPEMSVQILAENRSRIRELLPPNAFIVAEHGISYRVTYFLGFQSAVNPPLDESGYQVFYLIPLKGKIPRSCSEMTVDPSPNVEVQPSSCIHIDSDWYLLRKDNPHPASIPS